MGRKVFWALCAALALAAGACDNGIGTGGGGDDTPATADAGDPSYWFKDIYEAAVGRLGVKIIDTPEIPESGVPGGGGEDKLGQAANCQYVCNAINKKWGTNIQPVAGTELWAANMEYTLKVVDLANKKLGITTSYGTGSYATKQAADTIAVDQCVKTLIGPRKFVAVAGSSNKAAYSADGINWTAATLPSSAIWYSVTYGNGKFVAVAYGSSNAAAYSADGINWTAASMPSSGDWRGVTYGNGRFVAVAYSNSSKAAYSADGINWTAATLPSSADWYSVNYGNGRFVAVDSSSNKAAYSADGINWTAATMPSSTYWEFVTYGNGRFVAVANNNNAAYSADGINWTAATLPSSGSWMSVCYGG